MYTGSNKRETDCLNSSKIQLKNRSKKCKINTKWPSRTEDGDKNIYMAGDHYKKKIKNNYLTDLYFTQINISLFYDIKDWQNEIQL
jgi:hypothetical protein